ncbi:uncharacterized protein LOC133384541 [Rhineura floridana]|uniref:uncharacterized protein LOC133384541 n=1 Tax=Rhineura floridana TaxID=261503 RepID=UPI002AC8381E|nr:uncharacterized protein LOC133384541 [Rhineura floridana]
MSQKIKTRSQKNGANGATDVEEMAESALPRRLAQLEEGASASLPTAQPPEDEDDAVLKQIEEESEEDEEEEASDEEEEEILPKSMQRYLAKQMQLLSLQFKAMKEDHRSRESFARKQRPLRGGRPDLHKKAFPTFHETDDIFTFFQIFAHSCRDQGVPKKYWMSALFINVEGELRELLNSLPVEFADDFDHFYALARSHFALTAEDCFRRLKADQKKPKESFAAFSARMGRNVERWANTAEAASRGQVLDLFAKELFYRHLPRTLAEAGLLADRMFKNRAGEKFTLFRKPENVPVKLPGQEAPGMQKPWQPSGGARLPQAAPAVPEPGLQKKLLGEILCFKCGKKGHKANSCFEALPKPTPTGKKNPKVAPVVCVRDLGAPGVELPEISSWSSADENDGAESDFVFSAPNSQDRPETPRGPAVRAISID